MEIAVAADLINAAALILGIGIGVTQFRDYRKQRRREAMLELVRSFQSPEFARALNRINALPDGADRRTIHERLGPDGEDDVFLVGLTWESLGVLVYRGEITIDLIRAFYSGLILVTWRKLRVFVEEDRRFVERETVWEWYQWLAERMLEQEALTPVTPAHLAHRGRSLEAPGA